MRIDYCFYNINDYTKSHHKLYRPAYTSIGNKLCYILKPFIRSGFLKVRRVPKLNHDKIYTFIIASMQLIKIVNNIYSNTLAYYLI